MAKLSTLRNVEQPQSVILYGPSKTGKTTLAAELAAAGYNLLWIDLENGKQAVLTALRDNEAALDRIEYVQVPDTSENPVAIRTIGKVFAGKAGAICEAHGEWNCTQCKKVGAPEVRIDLATLDSSWVIVVDTVSQLSDSALAHATRGVMTTLFTGNPKVEWDHFAHQGMMLSHIFSNMQQLRCHRVFISHEEVIETNDGKESIMPKCGTRNYSRNFARFFDHVVYCYRENNKHKQASSTAYRPNVLTGSRTSVSMESGAKLADLLRGVQPAAPAKEASASAVAATSTTNAASAALLAKMKR